ncbi:hypothetical protein DFQ28_010437 [Apophysomyces sp. BC1034]|nr:hypothetical protein DFQ30_010085 [Apophysomyces sp. BC1015]KAG0171250.1 hypothetical protein DFQ29_008927 [Apophysomyces sp. BC1021]KAG0184807.1 hypothetical protein DFQ28_010437 [Apophysomyces sp. BC1034]
MAAVAESRYKSILKPVKFWQRSNKTAPAFEEDEENIKSVPATENINENAAPPAKTKPKLFIHTPFSLLKKQSSEPQDRVALVETAEGQVYKLSTINDSGVYLPPSPCEDGKHDHWLDIDQETMAFRLPSHDRLTTHSGEAHCFHTPSATIHNRSSLLEKN